MLSFLLATLLYSIVHSTDDEIRFCSIGLGHFGKLAAKAAIKKNINLVSAFTRSSNIGADVGDILNLGYKLNVKVSPLSDLDHILKQSKPNICFDATTTTLSGVYDNYVILLNNKVNIISLAEQHVFPFDDTQYSTVKQLAIDNDVTVFGTGFQDLHFQQYVLSLSSSMISITAVDMGWYGDFNKGAFVYASYVGIGLNGKEFYDNKINDPTENIFSHLMSEWAIAIAKWNANVLGLNEINYELTIRPILNDGSDGDIFGVVIDRMIGSGFNLGINITLKMETVQGVDIYFRSELRCYKEGMNGNNVEIAFYGDPEVRKLVIPRIDIENGTILTAVNRIPQVIKAKAGYYNVEQLGLAKYWNGVSVGKENKKEL